MTAKTNNEFEEKNLSLCESNCEYNGYDNNTKKALCECEVKIKLPLISEIVINKDKLYKKFFNVKNSPLCANNNFVSIF